MFTLLLISHSTVIIYLLSIYSVQLVLDDPVFRLDDKYFLSREEAFDRAMEKSVHYVKMCKKLELDQIEKSIFKK